METSKVKLLSNAMLAYTWRMQALTSNAANLDTPGYQRLSVDFEESLQQARRRVAGPDDTSDVGPRVNVEDGPALLEDELMGLADTQARTQMASRALREHFELVRTGITGRTA